MNAAQITAVSHALQEHTDGMAAINRKLSQKIKSIPGAAEALRRYLAAQGMNAQQVSQILACDVPPSAVPALLNLATPKN